MSCQSDVTSELAIQTSQLSKPYKTVSCSQLELLPLGLQASHIEKLAIEPGHGLADQTSCLFVHDVQRSHPNLQNQCHAGLATQSLNEDSDDSSCVFPLSKFTLSKPLWSLLAFCPGDWSRIRVFRLASTGWPCTYSLFCNRV